MPGEWNEDLHPRDSAGKFTSVGSNVFRAKPIESRSASATAAPLANQQMYRRLTNEYAEILQRLGREESKANLNDAYEKAVEIAAWGERYPIVPGYSQTYVRSAARYLAGVLGNNWQDNIERINTEVAMINRLAGLPLPQPRPTAPTPAPTPQPAPTPAPAPRSPIASTARMIDRRHAREVRGFGSMSEAERKELLGTFDRAGLYDFLERQPLGVIGNTTLRADTNGLYRAFGAGQLLIDVNKVSRRPLTHAPFNGTPGWTVRQSPPPSTMKALQDVLIHEAGHHVHISSRLVRMRNGQTIEEFVKATYGRNQFLRGRRRGSISSQRGVGRRRGRISLYSDLNDREYFAESFAAYRTQHELLRRNDPVGFEMVEKVLTTLNIPTGPMRKG